MVTIRRDVPDRNPATRQIISVDGEGWNIPLTPGVTSANPAVTAIDAKTGEPRGWHSYVMVGAADDNGFARSIVHDGSRREGTADTARNYGLPTAKILDFLLDLPREAMKVSFAFSYDFTKIVADLPLANLRELARESVNTPDWEAERARRMEYVYHTFGIPYAQQEKTLLGGTFRIVDAGTTIYDDRYWIAYTPRKVLHVYDLTAGKVGFQNMRDGKPIGRVEQAWKRSVTVWDAFGFFQKSFVGALRDYRCGQCASCKRARTHCKAKCLECATANYCETAPWTPDDITRIADMKEQRGVFKPEEQTAVLEYCLTECRYLSFLFRDLYVNIDNYDTDMRKKMTRYDGTGAIASAWMKRNETKQFLPVRVASAEEYARTHGTEVSQNSILRSYATLSGLPETVALSAYFGGRFEVSEIGSMGDLYGYDINSAYPHIARTLPCLAHGQFRRVSEYEPGKFGVYLAGSRTSGEYAPFPFRTPVKSPDGLAGSAIYYAHGGKRWIWSNANPEQSEIVMARRHFGTDAIPIYDGYVWDQECECESPFAKIPEMYAVRQEYVSQGNGTEKVIKLILNSLYGKTAQSVGWSIDKNGIPNPPPFQCFIWAGLITSGCRAMIMSAFMQPDANVKSIATDGILSTTPIAALDVPKEKILGKWDYSEVKNGYLFQSGVYTYETWNKYDQAWKRTFKTRGFSAKEITAQKLIDAWETQTRTVKANPEHSRFIPMRSGVTRTDGLEYIGQWVPSVHDVSLTHNRRIPRVAFDEFGDITGGLERYSDAPVIGCRECDACYSGHGEMCDNPPESMPYEPKQSWQDVLDAQPDMSDMDYLDDETGKHTIPRE